MANNGEQEAGTRRRDRSSSRQPYKYKPSRLQATGLNVQIFAQQSKHATLCNTRCTACAGNPKVRSRHAPAFTRAWHTSPPKVGNDPSRYRPYLHSLIWVDPVGWVVSFVVGFPGARLGTCKSRTVVTMSHTRKKDVVEEPSEQGQMRRPAALCSVTRSSSWRPANKNLRPIHLSVNQDRPEKEINQRTLQSYPYN